MFGELRNPLDKCIVRKAPETEEGGLLERIRDLIHRDEQYVMRAKAYVDLHNKLLIDAASATVSISVQVHRQIPKEELKAEMLAQIGDVSDDVRAQFDNEDFLNEVAKQYTEQPYELHDIDMELDDVLAVLALIGESIKLPDRGNTALAIEQVAEEYSKITDDPLLEDILPADEVAADQEQA